MPASKPLRIIANGFSGSPGRDRKSTRLNSSHVKISYAVFGLKKKKGKNRDKGIRRKPDGDIEVVPLGNGVTESDLVVHDAHHPRLSFFFFNDPATTEIYTLSLHDALPICERVPRRAFRWSVSSPGGTGAIADRKSTRLNSSHVKISYAVFCLKKKKQI